MLVTADASSPALSQRRSVRPPSPVTLIGLGLVAVVVGWLIVNLFNSPAIFAEAFLIGLTNGCIYALVALGYTLVYGILELINFANGDVFMLGGMFAFTFATCVRAASGAGAALAVDRADPDHVRALLRRDQRDDRGRRLSPVATCASNRAADHRDRGELHPPDGRPDLAGPEPRCVPQRASRRAR